LRRAGQRFFQTGESAEHHDGILNRPLQLCHAGRLIADS
jgi:hypothetical protein